MRPRQYVISFVPLFPIVIKKSACTQTYVKAQHCWQCRNSKTAFPTSSSSQTDLIISRSVRLVRQRSGTQGRSKMFHFEHWERWRKWLRTGMWPRQKWLRRRRRRRRHRRISENMRWTVLIRTKDPTCSSSTQLVPLPPIHQTLPHSLLAVNLKWISTSTFVHPLRPLK